MTGRDDGCMDGSEQAFLLASFTKHFRPEFEYPIFFLLGIANTELGIL